MSNKKIRKRARVSSTILNDNDIAIVNKICEESGNKNSVILRALIRAASKEWQEKKISTLEICRLGAY